MSKPEVTRVVACKDGLGECPIWWPREQRLYWIDVTAPRLSWYEPVSGRTESWTLPKPIGSFALRERGGFLLAFRSALAFFDPHTGAIEWHPEAVDLGETRFNDGKCDRKGRFWAGTLDRKFKDPLGKLYKFEAGLTCTEVTSGIYLSNGLGWSPDDRTMYFTDTRAHAIYAFDFDLDSGRAENRRIFAAADRPDGLTVDAEGFVWSAQVHNWNITRFDPTGKIERVIELPVERPTSCIFGGPNLDTLYVTSSTMTLSEEQLAKQPLAGGLFAIDVGIKGLPEPRFAG